MKQKPKIGQLWLWQQLPPMMFVYTDMGWLYMPQCENLSVLLNIFEQAEKIGERVWKRKTKPTGARRLV